MRDHDECRHHDEYKHRGPDPHDPYKGPRERRPPRIKEEPRGVWLVIRYDMADAGVRPIPNSDVFWLSPDIWITGGDGLGNAIAGKPTKVHARIWNHGNFPATPTRVDFAFCDPAMGIPWTAAQLIGTAWISVPPLSTVVVDCPKDWIPAATGTSHSCLLVTCSAILMDPAVPGGTVVTDRHRGQRNVTIVQAAAGQKLEFDFMIARTLQHRGAVEIAAMAAFGDDDPRRTVLAAGTVVRTLQLQTRAMPIQQAQLLSKRSLMLHSLEHDARYQLLEAGQVKEMLNLKVNASRATGEAFLAGQGEALGNLVPLGRPVAIEPLSTRRARVTLTVPRGSRPLIVHFFQFEDQAVTGGHTVIVSPPRKKVRTQARESVELRRVSEKQKKGSK